MRRSAPLRALCISSVCLSLQAVTARAEYRHRVVMLSPSANASQDSLVSELQARLRGELTAAGLEVTVVGAPAMADVRDAVETSASDLSPSAVLGVREVSDGSSDQATIEVWISDRLSHRTLVQRAAPGVRDSNQIALLAVQVSELFKARLGLLWIEPNQPAPAPAQPPPPPIVVIRDPSPEAPPTAPARGILFGAGFGVIEQLAQPVTAWFPSLQIGFEPGGTTALTFALRVNVGFTPSEAAVEHAGAEAGVSQGWGFVQGFMRFVPQSIVQPTLSLGGGVYSVGVKGRADAPDTARDERTWSAAMTAGVGVWLETSTDFAFMLEGQALSTGTKTVVRIRGEEAATFGFPAAILSASLVGRY